MSDTVLEIKNVSKYFGKTKVVDNLSFEVKAGEILGFLGPNGAGKTTTIKMILGLISIDEGSISINGHDVKKDFEKAMENIGGIVENPDLYGYMTAVENLKLHAKIRGVDYKDVYDTLKLVGLEKSMNIKVSKYSLGMKQRAGLALSLLHKPKILILDEPTNGLDPVGIKDLRDILKKLVKEQNIAVLVSSHILSEMELMCDRVVVINKGKFVKTQALGKDSKEADNVRKYAIKTNAIEDVQKVLKEKIGKDSIVVDGKVIVDLKPSETSNVLKTLVLNNVEIETLNECENTLESIFFDVTKEGKKDE